MREKAHTLEGDTPGVWHSLRSLHFGPEGTGRKAYIQCALHADEIPGLLVGVHLRQRLLELEAHGRLLGEVVLVPMANPLGLAQEVLGSPVGRFDLASGINYNRGYQYLTPGLRSAMEGQWSSDAETNVRRVRQAAARLLEQAPAATEAQALKKLLQRLAIDADVVLDLHSDSEALLHLYAGTPTQAQAETLAACIGAHAVLLAKESGDDPFDESVSRHWWELAETLPAGIPLPQGCFSVTIELRGEADVDHATASRDAAGLLRFLETTGHLAPASISDGPEAVPCVSAPLEGVDPITAPLGGIVVFSHALGATVRAGEAIGEVIDPSTGRSEPLVSKVDGLFFARTNRRSSRRGSRLAKVAGSQPFRSGKLLSA